jgi:malonate-semialdehyde dehydrogenase (acetylating)/methylmalonate-semialdehyde dehydrogenase
VKLKILFEQRLDELARLIAQNVGKTVAEAHRELRRAVETIDMALAEPHYAAEVRKIVNIAYADPGIDM